MGRRGFLVSACAFAALASGLSACVEVKENGGAYTGVDDDTPTEEFADISGELIRISADPAKLTFACQTSAGNVGLLLERTGDRSHLARYFERANGLLVERQQLSVEDRQDYDAPGIIYFLDNDKGNVAWNRGRNFWLRVEGDQVRNENGFIPAHLKIELQNEIVTHRDFFCRPLGIPPIDEWGYLRLIDPAKLAPDLAIVRLRGLEARDLYTSMKAAGATDAGVRNILPEPLVDLVAKNSVVCAAKVYSRSFTVEGHKPAYNCAFLLDASGRVKTPTTAAHWGPLLAVTQYSHWLLIDELKPESPRRGGAQGYANKVGVVSVTGGNDLAERIDAVTASVSLRVEGASSASMFTEWLKNLPVADGADTAGVYSERVGLSTQFRCRQYQGSLTRCTYGITKDGTFTTAP